MIANFNEKMWLGVPLNFHDICTIYPLTLRDYLVYSDIHDDSTNGLSYNALFTQFMINHDFLEDAGVKYDGDMWSFFFMSGEQLARLVLGISILTRDDGLSIDVENRRICFANGKYLSSETFPEFCDIVLQAHCFGQYNHVEKKTPTFKSKAAYERWKRYQAMRAKNQPKDELNIAQCIKFIQLYSNSYIPEETMLGWTYWKLLHLYNATILKSNYDELQQCFAHWGGKEIRKSLDSLKNEIMTKV